MMKSVHGGVRNYARVQRAIVINFPQANSQMAFTNLKHRMAVQRTIDLIKTKMQDPPTLGELASFSGLSRAYFSYVFKAVTGMKLRDYIFQVRLEKAKDLLLNHICLSIKEIAHQSGFKDSNYFCRVFKTRMGQNPTSWRLKKISALRNSPEELSM